MLSIPSLNVSSSSAVSSSLNSIVLFWHTTEREATVAAKADTTMLSKRALAHEVKSERCSVKAGGHEIQK